MSYILNGKPIPFKVSPNHSARPHGVEPSLIVLHSTGGSFSSAVNWLTKKVSGVSAHFVISRKGEIVQLVDCAQAAWHAGVSTYNGKRSVNAFSIGIEQEHIDGQQDWPDVQIKAAAQLCQLLMNAYPHIQHCVSHASVALPAGRKCDPLNYPWEKFRSYLG
jgi:N-acetyl-anhydromuramyl-L-alanine amidase AmpD